MGVGGCELGKLVFGPFQAVEGHLKIMVVVLAFFGKLHDLDDMSRLYFARLKRPLCDRQKPVVASAASADFGGYDFCSGELKFFFEALLTSIFYGFVAK